MHNVEGGPERQRERERDIVCETVREGGREMGVGVFPCESVLFLSKDNVCEWVRVRTARAGLPAPPPQCLMPPPWLGLFLKPCLFCIWEQHLARFAAFCTHHAVFLFLFLFFFLLLLIPSPTRIPRDFCRHSFGFRRYAENFVRWTAAVFWRFPAFDGSKRSAFVHCCQFCVRKWWAWGSA